MGRVVGPGKEKPGVMKLVRKEDAIHKIDTDERTCKNRN